MLIHIWTRNGDDQEQIFTNDVCINRMGELILL